MLIWREEKGHSKPAPPRATGPTPVRPERVRERRPGSAHPNPVSPEGATPVPPFRTIVPDEPIFSPWWRPGDGVFPAQGPNQGNGNSRPGSVHEARKRALHGPGASNPNRPGHRPDGVILGSGPRRIECSDFSRLVVRKCKTPFRGAGMRRTDLRPTPIARCLWLFITRSFEGFAGG